MPNFISQNFQMIFQILLALVLGMTIGIEREHRKKSAGMRTFALVSLGSALFTIISVNGFQDFVSISSYDPSRVVSQIVVGIGFIGAGLIFLKENKVQGLTTAAGLWATAAIGASVGLRLYFLAIFAALAVLSVLWLLRAIENKIPRVNENNAPDDKYDAPLS